MGQRLWTAVDEHFERALMPADPALDAAVEAAEAAGLPPISVTPAQGLLLGFLVRMQAARRVLEIGTLGGYSAIWMARALPEGGRLTTLEVDPRHAEVARANLANAGVGDVAEVILGPALETLPKLAADGAGPYDLVFIDADKPNNAGYFTWAVELSRPGTVIVVDNVVRGGAVAGPADDDPGTQGVHRLTERIKAEPRVSALALQTVGRKGYDGFVMAMVDAH
jgi:predicted O-methyltransferase YrrM